MVICVGASVPWALAQDRLARLSAAPPVQPPLRARRSRLHQSLAPRGALPAGKSRDACIACTVSIARSFRGRVQNREHRRGDGRNLGSFFLPFTFLFTLAFARVGAQQAL